MLRAVCELTRFSAISLAYFRFFLFKGYLA